MSANILEVSRVGSHEVSEALVSKRATREAEREEMGYGVSQRRAEENKYAIVLFPSDQYSLT